MAKVIYRPPHEFKVPKGITTDAVFLYGSKTWQDKLIPLLRKIQGLNILCSSGNDADFAWDVEALDKAEVAAFYLVGNESPFILSHLISPGWHRFPAEIYVYVTEKCNLYQDILLINEKTGKKFFKMVDNQKELGKMVVESFNYLL